LLAKSKEFEDDEDGSKFEKEKLLMAE